MPGGARPSKGHKPNMAAKRNREIYRLESRLRKNKLKRVRQSNGLKAARQYAKEYALTAWAVRQGLIPRGA